MPPGVGLNPGDKVNDDQIIIPGQPKDDPNTPDDESQTRVVPGPLTIPGTPPSPPPPPSIFPSPQPLPTSSPSPSPSPSPDPSASPSTQPPTASGESPSPSPDPAPTPSEGDSSSSSPDSSSNPPGEPGEEQTSPTARPTPEPYINNNPAATSDEVRVGEFLDREAQAGRVPRVDRVEGAAETPGARSGDYRFKHPDGSETPADLYQPESGNPRSISSNIVEKSGQAETVVVELGAGNSGQITDEQARSMAEDVINTPDHSVNRVIVIRNNQIIVDYSL